MEGTEKHLGLIKDELQYRDLDLGKAESMIWDETELWMVIRSES